MEVQGRAFADDEDWLAYLRDVDARPEVREIEAAAKGTPQAKRIAEAALALVEDGGMAELARVQGMAVHEAHGAEARLRALLERPGLTAEGRAWLDGEHRRALVAAARGASEWPAGLVAYAAPEEELLIELWQETPVAKRRAYLEAVVAAGEAHLDALIAGARALAKTSRDQAAPLMMMLAPHLPDPTSGEIVVEAMVGTLRANRKDPRQGELAERVLRKHELWPKKPGDGD
jgi:hypothetical protein